MAGRWCLLRPESPLAGELCRAAGGLEGWCAGAARAAGRAPPPPGAGLLAGPAAEWGLVLGRGVRASQGVRLPAEWVHCSGRHAQVAWSDAAGGYVLRDLSTNGTYCEKQRVPRGGEVALLGGETVDFVSGVGGGVTEDGVVRFRVELAELEPATASAGTVPTLALRTTPASGRKRRSPDAAPLESPGSGALVLQHETEVKAMSALERANRELRMKLELERSRVEGLKMELQHANQKTCELREDMLQSAQAVEAGQRRAQEQVEVLAGQLEAVRREADAARASADAQREEREAAQKAARAAHREVQEREAQIAHLELTLETEVSRGQEKHAEAKNVLLAAEARLDQVVKEARAAGAQAEEAARKLRTLSEAAELARCALQDWEQKIPTQPHAQNEEEPLMVANTQFPDPAAEAPLPGLGTSMPAPCPTTGSPPGSPPEAGDMDQTEELPTLPAQAELQSIEPLACPVAAVELAPGNITAGEVDAPPAEGPEEKAEPPQPPARVLGQDAAQALNVSQGDGGNADANMLAASPLKPTTAVAGGPQEAACAMDVENITPPEEP